MQIKIYTIDVHLPGWLKRAIVFGAIPATVLLGAVHYLRADVAVPSTFSNGQVISAAQMNDNFSALQTGINSLAATVGAGLVPPGTVVAFAGSAPPTGWLACDGSAVSRTQYSALFAAIGVTYGIGDAVDTFNLPDLRAASIRGVGTSTQFASNATVALGQKINDQFQGHTLGDGSRVLMRHVSSYGDNQSVGIGALIHDSPTHMKSVVVSDGTHGTPRTGAETTGKAIGMNFIIKY